MDAVSVSQTAMDAVSASETAMDAVIASEDIALDTVVHTQTAMDAVSTSQTAMDAVSVSALAMEAIAASQIAMDAVVAATDVGLPTVVETETAMNEVSLSDLALDTLWASTDAWDLIKANAMAVGKFAAGRAGLSGYDYADIDAVATSQTAMDAVSTSATAMDAVSTSATAMDAVSSSDLAMDAIWDSQDVAWAAVRDLAMAVGKFVAGRAGLEPQDYADIDAVAADQAAMDAVSTSQTAMDAVSTSQTAMDAVSTSQTAMDAVSASIVARTTALLSSAATDAIWSSELAADAMWNIATPALPWTDSNWDAYLISRSNVGNLPQTWADGNTSTPPPDDTRSEKAFVMDNIGSSDGTDHGISFTLDFNEISTLNVYTYMYVKTWGPDNSTMHIKVDGSKLWESADGTNGGDHSWTQRSLDVSGLNGELEVELGAQDNNSDTWVALFDEVTAQ